MNGLINMIRMHWITIVIAVFLLYMIKQYWTKQTTLRANTPNEIAKLSYLANVAYPRGMRNNNPGNLVRTSIDWDGKIAHSISTDSKYEQFQYYWQGVRAMIKDIVNDMTQDGDNTIRKLIYRYAPPDENRTNEYIGFVADKSARDPDDTLIPAPADLYPIVKAMAHFETGNANAITEPIYNYAYTQI